MEKRIRERFSDSILEAAIQCYGIPSDTLRPLHGFENFIYEYACNGQSYILRIGHSLRRSSELICGEVDWLNYLAAGGASVSPAVLSERGNLVESIPDARGGEFLVTAFIKAEGHPPGHEWRPALVDVYGQAVGRMHALTRSYSPKDPAWARPQWDDPIMLEIETLLPESEHRVVQRYHELLAYLHALPKGNDAYGLVHQDAHGGNFFVTDTGKLTLFDFDDCAYTWYANDIGIALFYAVIGQSNEQQFTHDFLTHFLRGYEREYQLDAWWIAEIPHFLKLREIDLYAIIHRSFDVSNLTDSWIRGYMHGRKELIEAGTPYIDFDFESFALHWEQDQVARDS